MCFSHIFPCLSCDEGQVAQIENQEVSKKFKVKKLTLRYRKVEMYICWVSRSVNRNKIENRGILDVLLKYHILLVYDKIIFF